MNGYFEHSQDISTETKNVLEAEMLKDKMNKAKKEIVEAEKRVNATTKRAKDAEMALQRSMEENSRTKGIQEA